MLAPLLLNGESDAAEIRRVQPDADLIPPGLTHARILVAEDDPVVRAMIQRLLTEEGCEVIAAQHGEEALRLAMQARSPLDLVVTDIRMPRMDDWELGRLLGDRWPHLPVLYFSGWDSELVRGAQRGGPRHGFLGKPFDPAELVGQIERLLRTR